jgi:hypothetical protein
LLADEKSQVLEKQLKTLGQKVRLDILKKLDLYDYPLPFSTLQKEVLGMDPHSKNFSFHLNALKSCDFIATTQEGYYLTSLGRKIFQKILSIEQIINEENKSVFIRTSKYSKEQFNIQKVVDYLMKEGELEQNLAKKIAREVEEKLLKANIVYLTTPLMREYINGILLENGLEEVRHKLTRLGTPPFEVFKLFEKEKISPNHFLSKLGSDVSEQFLLLNLLPKDLADQYLSGEIALIHLNCWSLRPLGVYISAKTIVDLIYKRFTEIPKNIQNIQDLLRLSNKFFDFLRRVKPYISADLLLGDFNRVFLSFMESFNFKEKLCTFELIGSQFLNYEDYRNKISIEFNYCNDFDSTYDVITQFEIDKEFIEALISQFQFIDNNIYPLILMDYSILNSLNLEREDNFISKITSSNQSNNLIFFNDLINSVLIKVSNTDSNNNINNKLILDKILINLHAIALESNQNDDIFIDILKERLDSVFEFFKYKEKFILQKLKNDYFWNQEILKNLINESTNLRENSLKSVSFFGLNQAVKHHCGIELDRVTTSEAFALEILNVMKGILEEKNDDEYGCYILTQPHIDSYLLKSKKSFGFYDKINEYSSRFLRRDSKLPLAKQINKFKKFEKIVKGGCIFNQIFDNDAEKINETLKMLYKSDINAFSINNPI